MQNIVISSEIEVWIVQKEGENITPEVRLGTIEFMDEEQDDLSDTQMMTEDEFFDCIELESSDDNDSCYGHMTSHFSCISSVTKPLSINDTNDQNSRSNALSSTMVPSNQHFTSIEPSNEQIASHSTDSILLSPTRSCRETSVLYLKTALVGYIDELLGNGNTTANVYNNDYYQISKDVVKP